MSEEAPTSASPATATPNTERSPRRGMCAAVLGLEAITLGLSAPVLITIAGVPVATGLTVGLGLAVASIVLAGMLRSEWAYKLGWVIQAAALGLGFVIPIMFLLGAIFAVLWGGADLLGRKIEREKAEAWAQWKAQQAAGDGSQV